MSAKFQRRHYEAIAKTLHDYAETMEEYRGPTNYLFSDFADMFAADNPNFDRVRFFAACGFQK